MSFFTDHPSIAMDWKVLAMFILLLTVGCNADGSRSSPYNRANDPPRSRSSPLNRERYQHHGRRWEARKLRWEKWWQVSLIIIFIEINVATLILNENVSNFIRTGCKLVEFFMNVLRKEIFLYSSLQIWRLTCFIFVSSCGKWPQLLSADLYE